MHMYLSLVRCKFVRCTKFTYKRSERDPKTQQRRHVAPSHSYRPQRPDANSSASIKSLHLRSAALVHNNAAPKRDAPAWSGSAVDLPRDHFQRPCDVRITLHLMLFDDGTQSNLLTHLILLATATSKNLFPIRFHSPRAAVHDHTVLASASFHK